MQTLANFRGYEDADIRRDRDDGRLRYGPVNGLPIQFADNEVNEPWQGWRFTSSVKEHHIYVYCLSTEKSLDLARRFESPFCIEIFKPPTFLGRLARRVRLRSAFDRRLLHNLVDYRDAEQPPGVDWALPERLAFIKPTDWSWQCEYRVVAARKGALAVENVELTLQAGPQPNAPAANDPPIIIRVGDISDCARLHRF